MTMMRAQRRRPELRELSLDDVTARIRDAMKLSDAEVTMTMMRAL